ncbi:MAG: FtsX-like permease family protein [Caldilineaceae bacterium SB0666_bin_21]|nr:FtsX-like permease family protein [Caldilineaceae bacterium SB0666_bin_21]
MALTSVLIALRALAANRIRSFLTMLGIIIGVFAVVVLVSVGEGVENYVVNVFQLAGTNNLWVVPGALEDEGTVGELTLADARAIENPFNVSGVKAVVAENRASRIATRGGESLEVEVLGIWPEHQITANWFVTEGGFITDRDIDERARVAIVGTGTAQNLFEPDEYPIGSYIKVDNRSFEVIGIMKEISGGVFGDFNDTVYLPFTTMQDRIARRKTVSGEYLANIIIVHMHSSDLLDQAQVQIEELMRERHRITFNEDDDFTVINQQDILSVFGGITAALTIFLGLVSAISLLVGGVGIMNIMLVSVTERTREIGLRKAVGARRGTILTQFIVESLTLAVLGGLIGVGLAGLGIIVVNNSLAGLDVGLGVDAVLLGVGFCAAIGAAFGIYPAWRASRLNPIQALRHE